MSKNDPKPVYLTPQQQRLIRLVLRRYRTEVDMGEPPGLFDIRTGKVLSMTVHEIDKLIFEVRS